MTLPRSPIEVLLKCHGHSRWCQELGGTGLLIRQEFLVKFLEREGMSTVKQFSLPERQKYFLASSPLAIVPTLLL